MTASVPARSTEIPAQKENLSSELRRKDTKSHASSGHSENAEIPTDVCTSAAKPHLPEDFSPTDAVYNLQFPTSVLGNDQPGQFPIGKLQKLVI